MSTPAWIPTDTLGLSCSQDHGRSGGGLDESARRLSHVEFAVAGQLAAEGHQVHALADRPGRGRTADLLVCGNPVEVKSWLSRDERGGRAPGVRSVANKLLQAEGQAATVVLDGRGSGLTAAAVRAGMAMYAESPHRGHVAAVRVLGDGFDLAWARAPGRDLARRLNGHQTGVRIPPDRRPDVGLGR